MIFQQVLLLQDIVIIITFYHSVGVKIVGHFIHYHM